MATSVKKAGKSASKKSYTLVIVESPAKIKPIEKYLGRGYTVKASMGHLIDLPKSRIAVDVEHNFSPEYIKVRGRAKILDALEKDAKKAGRVLLASDPDREGEAIAWHLKNAFEKVHVTSPIQRISFNEVTPEAVAEAVKSPRAIDEAKVNAQIARRVLDRLVGYNLSPLLWKKVKNGLSAGRVQSVALRLICEREGEVESFIPEEYWTLDADFAPPGKTRTVTAQLVSYRGEKPVLKNRAEAEAIVEAVKGHAASVLEVKTTEKSIKPRPPFTTSTLQQTAANRLGFTSRKTMQLAQQLYEGMDTEDGLVGLITYMRTDSVRVSKGAQEEARAWIETVYGKTSVPPVPNEYTVSGKAQDAHEGIRPTYVRYTPENLESYLSRDLFRLYTIIWERFVSSQMVNAKTAGTSVDIGFADTDVVFRFSHTILVEKGFYAPMKLLATKEETGVSSEIKMKPGDLLEAKDFRPEQHFTQGPARYTDSSIVKMLEEKGIGRPSTYAPIITTLLARYYVSRANKQLVPTALGRKINEILVESFSDVVNEEFTANIEKQLDNVEEKGYHWQDMIGSWFFPFRERIAAVMETLESVKGSMDEITDAVCEKCGKPMVKKLGRFGEFLACTGFPGCRNAKSIPLATCPKCGEGDIVTRKSRGRGRDFYGCTRYPECDFMTHYKPLDTNCPKCGWFMVERYAKKQGVFKSCINPQCDYLHSTDGEDPVIEEAVSNES